MIGVERVDLENGCMAFNLNVLTFLQENPEIETVILAARWSFHLTGSRYKSEQGQPIVWLLPEDVNSGNESAVRSGLLETIRQLQQMDRSIYLVDPVPEVGYNVPLSLEISLQTGRDANLVIGPTLGEYEERNAGIRNIFEEISGAFREVRVISPLTELCSARCLVEAEGKPLYFDDDHLSSFGARYISGVFEPIFLLSNP